MLSPAGSALCVIAFAGFLSSAQGTPVPDLPSWSSPLIPQPEDGAVKCYSLPYGGVGFLSHILTYWTVAMLISGRSPMLFGELKHWFMDLVLGIGSLCVSMVLSILAIVRCHSDWPFTLIATWKMLLSMSLSFIAIHRAIEIHRDRKTTKPAFWLILYCTGIIIGLTGLIALCVQNWSDRTRAMEIICGVFGGTVILLTVILVVIAIWADDAIKESKLVKAMSHGFDFFLFLLLVVGIMTALWSDWIIAALVVRDRGDRNGGGWAGTPSSDIAWLYWSYFAAKRLPFFSL